MDNTIVLKLVMKHEITDSDINDALYEICDSVHAGCDYNCPVYELNGGLPPKESEYGKKYGCDCFKSGSAMRAFIRLHYND